MSIAASVIIPTRNRAELLRRCLSALTRQTLAKDAFEVLVVDNGSTDATAEVANEFAGSLQLVYVSSTQPGLHVGRHEGARRARSDILMFADDDTEARATWVEAVVERFRDAKVALVGGNNHPRFEHPPPAWLEHWWAMPFYKGRALVYLSVLDFGEGTFDIDPRYVWGCNYSVRRSVLLSIGGFHPDGVPKELLRYRGDGETHVSDAISAAGHRTAFDSRASVDHWVPSSRMTQAYMEQRAYVHGISDSYTDIRASQTARVAPRIAALRWLATERAYLKARLGRLATAGRASPAQELTAIQLAASRAYRLGYEFHQREVRADAGLLAWVLRNDYWGAPNYTLSGQTLPQPIT